MTDSLNDSREELKRVDHLIYVSLKYTRTVDVIRSILDRLIAASDFLLDHLLQTAKNEKKIKDVPKLPGIKCDKVKELHSGDEKIIKFVEFYLLLRRVMRLEYTRSTEYRRHVYMGVILDGTELRVNIDLVVEYNNLIKEYFDYIRDINLKPQE